MPKTWLSLPEAEQLAVELTGSDPGEARAQIIEGCRNHEIAAMGRGETGYILNPLPSAAWSEVIWDSSMSYWDPTERGEPRRAWGRYLYVRIDRVSLERYLMPAVSSDRGAIAESSLRPDPGGKPRAYDHDAAYREVIRLAQHPDGLPDRPVLRKHLEKWFTDNTETGPPGPSWLDDFLRQIYAALK